MARCIYNSRMCVICRRPLPEGGRTERRECRGGLGDYVAAGLESVGITKERVSAITGAPCRCPERQAALNKLGKIIGIGVDNP